MERIKEEKKKSGVGGKKREEKKKRELIGKLMKDEWRKREKNRERKG